MLDVINDFHGKYLYLSNFYEWPIWFQGRLYPTNEHAFQAAKTLDETTRMVISEAKTPGQSKGYGRKLALRQDWENIKVMVMYDLCKQKFSSPTMAAKLLSTRDSLLIEGNTWGDKTWGTVDNVGINYLGKILMRVRAELRGESFDIY